MASKFELGQLLITPGALAELLDEEVYAAVKRHANGDWGEVCADDSGQNDWALKNGGRLFSAYDARNGSRFWIITEADRSSTTILLPEEY